MPNIITVTEPKRGLQCRILSPAEYRVIRENLSVNHKTIFDAKLFSGMRETEFAAFAKNPQWYDRERKIIRLTPKAVKKAKTLFKDRTVNLSTLGAAAVERFIDYKPKVPNRASWNETLKLAATKANVPTTGIEPKMARKTWESWLVATYPNATIYILASQGHILTTALQHYVGIGFSKEEIADIKQYTDGWLR